MLKAKIDLNGEKRNIWMNTKQTDSSRGMIKNVPHTTKGTWSRTGIGSLSPSVTRRPFQYGWGQVWAHGAKRKKRERSDEWKAAEKSQR